MSKDILARTVSALLGLPVAALLARGLQPAGFALFAVALAVANLVHTTIDFAWKSPALASLVGAHDRVGAIGEYLGSRVVACLPAAVVAEGLLWVSLPDRPKASDLLGAGLIAGTVILKFLGSTSIVLHLFGRPDIFGLVVLGQSLVWLGTVAGLFFSDHLTLLTVGIAFFAVQVGNGSALVLVSRRFIHVRYTISIRKTLLALREDASLMSASFLGNLQLRIPLLAAGTVASAVITGELATAMRLGDAAIALLAPVGLSLIPLFSLQGPGKLNQVVRASHWFAGLALGPGLFLGFAGGEVVKLLFGRAYVQAVPAVRLLACVLLLFSFRTIAASYWISTRSKRRFLVAHVLSLVSTAAGTVTLVPLLGSAGGMISLVAGETVLLVALWGRGILALARPIRRKAQPAPLRPILTEAPASGRGRIAMQAHGSIGVGALVIGYGVTILGAVIGRQSGLVIAGVGCAVAVGISLLRAPGLDALKVSHDVHVLGSFHTRGE